MENLNRIRATGISCIAGAIVWIFALFIEYGLGLQPPSSGALFYLNQAMFLVAMTGFVLGIVGLMWAQATGDGWLGRIALGLFALGWIVLIVATIVAPLTGNYDLPLFPIGGLVATVGGLLAGVAVAVGHRWSGWQRWSVLVYALYYLVALILPLVVANQEPTLITEAIWGLAWMLIGLAVYTSSGKTHPTQKVAAV
jgi:hypothetical protein